MKTKIRTQQRIQIEIQRQQVKQPMNKTQPKHDIAKHKLQEFTLEKLALQRPLL